MNPPITEEGFTERPSSSDPITIEIHVFHCGHGDTILLRLPQNRWALVDCYLPRKGAIRDRFFSYVEDLGIRQLDFIFQTHPDHDHFHGMRAVLDYFMREGRSVKHYFDSGINARQVRELFEKRVGVAEYAELQDYLEELDKNGVLDLRDLDANRPPVPLSGSSGRLQLIPIGPNPKAKRRLIRKDLRRYVSNTKAVLRANELSLVLVLAVNNRPQGFNALLAADATKPEIDRALEIWKSFVKESVSSTLFDVIKIPHHGSIHSHSIQLCQSTDSGNSKRIAAISVGTRAGLPDRELIRNYLDHGWIVMLTTTRNRKKDRDSPLTLSNRGPETIQSTFGSHDILIRWSTDKGLISQPEVAMASMGQLDCYETKVRESP
jgi:beta-lactamase superfamily II metal-dependent hydrolase